MLEIIDALRDRGYPGSFGISKNTPEALFCDLCRRTTQAKRFQVEEVFRFEGMTDPDDEAILLALRCPRCARGGSLVTAYGPAIEPGEAAVLTSLVPKHRKN
jgi:hypothetical protein